MQFIVRATAEVKTIPNAKRPGQNHGFQKCALIDADGFMSRFEMYFNPAKASFALEPGDHLVKSFRAEVTNERLLLYPVFEPVLVKPTAAKAA